MDYAVFLYVKTIASNTKALMLGIAVILLAGTIARTRSMEEGRKAPDKLIQSCERIVDQPEEGITEGGVWERLVYQLILASSAPTRS